ncbi:MAG: PIG-L family deacetylase [Chloroflexota bacterium]|nr:PIG-L family deacetylase [Chloroflexota bacterium]
MVVAPHPDDETIGAGGVAALHALAGDRVTVVVVSDGRGSQALDLSTTQMVARRRAEAEEAAKILGVQELVWLGLPEAQWQSALARAELAPYLESATIIYAPSCVDFHPEHLDVSRVVADVVQPTQSVRIYELSVPLMPLLVNLVADIHMVAPLKRQALACFTTQVGALKPLERLSSYRAALYGLADSEVFWELSAPAYRRVIQEGKWTWYTTPFRGLRARPFSDPLACMAGWQMRAQLRALAEQAEQEAVRAGSVSRG